MCEQCDTWKESSLMKILKELRTANGITQADLAKILKISSSTIGMYEQGRREPDKKILLAMADYFKVTTDYLLGHIPVTSNTTVNGDNNGTISTTTGSINNSTINNGTINGNIITPSTTENDTCQMYHALSAEAKGQIDNLVKMLHDMENKK